jgi:hypothetical protein
MTVTRGYAASSAWPKTSSSAVAAPAAMAGCTEIFYQRVITQPQATPGRDRRQQGDQLGGASKKNLGGGSGLPVLVVAAKPVGLLALLVAAQRRPIQQAVVAHRRLEAARGGHVRLVDGAVR